jgi:hypothetical protein
VLYECKVSWNGIVKGIKILVLKAFGVVYMKFMVREHDVDNEIENKSKY